MFSSNLEMVLHVAYREADSRRHAFLILEHLLFAILHDSQGEEILRACGADVPRLAARRRDVRRGAVRGVRARPALGP